MNTFSWRNIYSFETHKYTISLTEAFNGMTMRIWGICHKEGELYKVAVRTKDRKDLRTIEELLPLEEAKLAIEKKLFDDGVISEGDEVEDYTVD